MDLKDLETVTYDQATRLLGVTRQTLHNATSRGVLIPLRRRARQPGRLVKKQVELFIGKDLSLKWLSPQEAVIWQETKNAVLAEKSPESPRAVLALPLVEDQIAFIGSLLEGMADIALEVVESLVTAAQAGDVTPETLIDHVKRSPAFHRMMSLFGVEMEGVPDETARAIDAMAREVAEKVQAKLFALLLKYAAQDVVEKIIPELAAAPGESQRNEPSHKAAS